VARHIRPLIGWGRSEYSIIYVEDLCQAVWLTLTRETRPQSTYFINDGQPIHQLRDITALVAKAIGSWTLPIPVPGGLVWAAERVLTLGQRIGLAPARITPDKLREMRQSAWTCSADLITENLGFKPSMPLVRGISETAAWYRAKGWL